jgi:hypothetical protein
MTSLQLIHDLWAKSEPVDCCPHVSHDADGCRGAGDHQSGEVREVPGSRSSDRGASGAAHTPES